MDPTQYETAVCHLVEAADLARERRADLLQRLAGGFARRKVAAQAGQYIDGLTADLPHRQDAAAAQPRGMGPPAAQQVVHEFVIEHLADADGVLVLDESGQEKAGTDTVEVKRQYVGCTGKITNAVNVVYATYATSRGHAIVGARLYLPVERAEDARRRRRAGTPDEVTFATKPELGMPDPGRATRARMPAGLDYWR